MVRDEPDISAGYADCGAKFAWRSVFKLEMMNDNGQRAEMYRLPCTKFPIKADTFLMGRCPEAFTAGVNYWDGEQYVTQHCHYPRQGGR